MLYLSEEKNASIHGLRPAEQKPAFRYFNPSVAVAQERLFISLRGLNVERSDVNGKFYLLKPETEIKTRIIVGEYDANLNCLGQFEMNPSDLQTSRPFCPGGHEDMRLIAAPDGALVGIACEPGPQRSVGPGNEIIFDPTFKMRMSRLDFGPKFQIAKVTTYDSPFGRLREKNWSPFFHEGKLWVVYQWNPLIVLELCPDGTTRFVKWFSPSIDLKGLRGGSPGIVTPNGYLFVVHRQIRVEGKLRFTHQFVELGPDLQPHRISEEFCFLTEVQIEYGSGLARSGDYYVLTFGLDDSLPLALRIPVENVERLLRPLAAPPAENRAILDAPRDEQAAAAAVDFPKDPELGRVRLAKLRTKAWLNRLLRRELQG